MEQKTSTGKPESQARPSGAQQGNLMNPQGASANLLRDVQSDIQQTLGLMPSFVKQSPYQGLVGSWVYAKDIRFSDNTAIDLKYKDLISLAVSSQVPGEQCAIFDMISARNHQLSEQETSEAVFVSGFVKVESGLLNGTQVDFDVFQKEITQCLKFAKDQMQKTKEPPSEEFFVKKFANLKDTYKDIEATFGFVPKFILAFPEEAVPGFWSEKKGLLLNPHTAVPGKIKDLIGLAVASQIPCRYCIYFHTEVAKFLGADDREIREAVAIGATAAHWGTVFKGLRVDPEAFKQEFSSPLQS